jgi:hypothetical protein
MTRLAGLCLMASVALPGPAAGADSANRSVQKWARELDQSDPSKRLKAVGELARLGRPALPFLLTAAEDPDARVRTQAAAAVSAFPPTVLAEVARTHTDAKVRAIALAAVTDQPTLAQLAREGPPNVAAAAVARLSDVGRLADLARTGPEGVRTAALGRISDAAVLGGLLREAGPEVGAAAARRLIELAAAAPAAQAAQVFLREVTDRGALLELVRSGAPGALVLLAGATTDVTVLAALAAHPEVPVALAAAGASRDPQVLEAALGHPSEDVRARVVGQGLPQERLARIARGDAAPGVRVAAASRLTATRTLQQLATSDPDPRVKRAAAFLLRQPARGTKPLVGYTTRKADRFLEPLRARLPSLLGGRALLLECQAQGDDCALLPVRVDVEVEVRDSDQCFSKLFFGGGYCGNPGKDVELRLTYHRDGRPLGQHVMGGRTPKSVEYKVTVIGGVALDNGPDSNDVWRATEKSVKAGLAAWAPQARAVDLERFLAW